MKLDLMIANSIGKCGGGVNDEGNERISNAECFEERPIDRDYNKHGKERITQIEILGDGLSYAIRTAIVYGVIIEYEDG